MNTQQKLKEAREQAERTARLIAELEQQADAEQMVNPLLYSPKKAGEEYLVAGVHGVPLGLSRGGSLRESPYYEHNILHPTQESCQREIDRNAAKLRCWRFIAEQDAEHGADPVDWGNREQAKYSPVISFDQKGACLDTSWAVQMADAEWYSTRKQTVTDLITHHENDIWLALTGEPKP